MKTSIAIFLTFAALAISGTAQSLPDPVQHYLSDVFYEPGDQMYRLESDLNGDGLNEVFLTLSRYKSEESLGEEFGWRLYIATSAGYVQAGQKVDSGHVDLTAAVGIRKDAYRIGIIPEVNSFGLLTISECCTTKVDRTTAQLVAIVLDGDSFKEIRIGEPTEDAESLKKRFPRDLVPQITVQSVP